MAYKEDVIIVYSKDAWNEMIAKMSSTLISKMDRAMVVNLINSAELHQTDDDDNHMLVFERANSTTPDMIILIQTLAPHTDQWKVRLLGEDGMEDEYGYFDNDQFSPRIHREFHWDDRDNVPFALNIPDPPDQIVVKSTVVKDDHTCVVCGNTKCSKREKSCWRCGNPI